MSADDLAPGLERFLGEQWGGPVTVSDLRVASAGARRRNVLFEANGPEHAERLVATVIPTAEVQIVDVGIEVANLRLAEAAGVPVPHVVGVSDDPSYVGGPFFVSTEVTGETVPRQVLRLVDAHPGLGPTLARQCGAALARLHAADRWSVHPDVEGPVEGGSPVDTALEGLRAQLDELLQPSAAFELGFRWLVDEAPSDDRVALVHRDLRNGNLVVGPDGLRAVLDWEASGLGSPMADLAWMCVRMWRFGNDHLQVGGFAELEDLRAGYEEAGGTWDGSAFGWWKVLGSLRWGLGLANQARQHLADEFRSIVMAASGRRVAELEYDVLMLLGRELGHTTRA